MACNLKYLFSCPFRYRRGKRVSASRAVTLLQGPADIVDSSLGMLRIHDLEHHVIAAL